MAQSITDCTGKTISVGDKVKTEHGDVIEVCGGMVSEHKLFNAEKCTVVDKHTPLTNTGHVTPKKLGAHKQISDCVVWGT